MASSCLIFFYHTDYVHVSLRERVHGAQCPYGLDAATPPGSPLPDPSRRRQVMLQPDRLTPLGANGWCDGDTEGNTESVWLTEGEAPKDKIWGCDDLAKPL